MDAIQVGIDLVEIGEVRAAIGKFGERYLSRIYTEHELAYASSSEGQRVARLAARFAAKEAVIKVLKPTDEPVPWRDIEVRRTPSGACEVALSGFAAELSRKAGIVRISVSLTHHGDHAAAVAAALCVQPGAAGSEAPRAPG